MRGIIVLIIICVTSIQGYTQVSPPLKKVTVVGAARGQFFGDTYRPTDEDTVTAKKLNSGNVLADLGLKIQANANMEILGMVRIRNDYGGFWGSGVSFDVRQLYVRGLIGNAVRYQLGDINYRMTPYTLWNNEQDLFGELPKAFSTQMQAINYDHFYNSDHSWRQQGASANVGFLFAKAIKEIQLNAVSTRIKTSDFSNQSDRVFVGLNAQVIQSESLSLGFNYADIFDIVGTSRNQTSMRNPIVTSSAHWMMDWGSSKMDVKGEAGLSARYTEGVDIAVKNGRFNDWKALWASKSTGLSLEMRYHFVNADFRSPGAQTRRLNAGGQLSAFSRIGNDQVLRPVSILDMMRETSLYNMQLQTSLGQYLPQYDNITPYGDATPNRQGYFIKGGYETSKGLWKSVVIYYNGRETKGEGTIEPRSYSRVKAETELLLNEQTIGWKSQLHLSAAYRNDRTERSGPAYLPQVNLKNEMIALGAEYLINKKWEILLGMQQVNFKGLEMKNIRDFNGEIVNFSEMELDGSEIMSSLGLRYFFSAQSYLSLQRFQWNGRNGLDPDHEHSIAQWMLLYQMNF